MQKLKWIITGLLLSLLIIAAAVFAYLKWNKTTGIDPFDVVPENAIYIFESDEPIKNWQQFESSEIWQFIKQHSYFKSINDDAEYLSELISENKFLLKTIGRRNFICSAHPISKSDYDYLFVIDLESAKDLVNKNDVLPDFLASLGFNISAKTHQDFQIINCKDVESKESIYITQIENQLVLSYNAKLVESSVNEFHNPSLAKNEKFQKVVRKSSDDGVGQLYIQWSMMDDYFAMYSATTNPWLNELTESMSFAALDLDIKGEMMRLSGYSNPEDSVLSYLNILRKSGQSKSEASKVLSNRTGFYWSLNFNSVSDFYSNLIDYFKENESEYLKFKKNKKRVEQYLNLSIEKDLISWMGKEVVLAQNKQFFTNSKEEYLVYVHVKDLDLAKSKLQKITEQVKKRTPAKFKKIHFRSYTIQYLELKGVFQLIFGSLFKDFGTAYYTIIDDYVVFSNSSKSLIGTIEDYENKRVLLNDLNHKKVKHENQMLQVYVAPPNAFNALLPRLNFSKSNEFKKNKQYFEGLGAFSLVLSSKSSLLKMESELYLNQDSLSEQIDNKDLIDLWQQRVEVKQKNQDEKEFELRIIEDGYYKQFYPASDQLFILARTKKGILHGKYTEYYQSGEVKCKGKYRKGQRTGQWRFYNEKGECIITKRY